MVKGKKQQVPSVCNMISFLNVFVCVQTTGMDFCRNVNSKTTSDFYYFSHLYFPQLTCIHSVIRKSHHF
jgi:hypothetical protein